MGTKQDMLLKPQVQNSFGNEAKNVSVFFVLDRG